MHSAQSPQKSGHPLDRPCAVLEEGTFFYSVPILCPEQSLCRESVVPYGYLLHQLGEGAETEGETETRQRERETANCTCMHVPKREHRSIHDTVCVWRSQRNSAVCPPTILFEVGSLVAS